MQFYIVVVISFIFAFTIHKTIHKIQMQNANQKSNKNYIPNTTFKLNLLCKRTRVATFLSLYMSNSVDYQNEKMFESAHLSCSCGLRIGDIVVEDVTRLAEGILEPFR